MVLEIFRSFRCAMLFKISGGSTDDALRCPERPGNQAGILKFVELYREIETFLDQIGVAGLEDQIDMDVRVDLHVGRNGGSHMVRAEEGAGAHFEKSSGLGLESRDGEFHLLHVVQDLSATFQIDRTDLGEIEVPGGSIEEPNAEAIFQLHDVLGGHGSGQPQLLSRGGKTPRFCDLGKNQHARQLVHRIPN